MNLSHPFPSSTTAPIATVSPAIAERLITEGLITLSQAAKLLPPTRGDKVSTSSIFRWIVRGKHGVRLEAVKLLGQGWSTSKPALARFAAAVTAKS